MDRLVKNQRPSTETPLWVDTRAKNQHPSIRTPLWVDTWTKTMHPFLGSVFWSGMLPFVFPGCLGGEGFSSAGSRSPSRAPAGGREETRSPPILPAPSPATDKKKIYRLFSALPGNNRSQKEVFLVQLGCAGGNFAITQPLLPKNRPCLFFQIWLCCLRMYKVAGFSILRQVFP